MHRDRRKKIGTPVVGVVGYTSAGKSTLVSNLSRTHLESRDRSASFLPSELINRMQ